MRQSENKFVTEENKKSICNGTEVKPLKALPKERKSLPDELAYFQKKTLPSYLIIHPDPVSDDADPIEDMSDTVVNSHPTPAEQDSVSTNWARVNADIDVVHPEADTIKEVESDNESETGNKLDADKKKRKETSNRISSKDDSKVIKSDDSEAVCDIEYIMDESPSSSKMKGVLTGISVLHEVLHSVQHLISSSDQEQQVMLSEGTDISSVTTYKIIAVSSKDGTHRDEIDHSVKKTEVNVLTEIQTCGKKKEYVTDPTIIGYSCKNLDLEWNKENVKLSRINVPYETCMSDSGVKLADNNDRTSKSLSALQKSEVSSYKPSFPVLHASSAYESHTNMSHQRELAVVKHSEQNREPSLSSINANARDPQPSSVSSQLPCI